MVKFVQILVKQRGCDSEAKTKVWLNPQQVVYVRPMPDGYYIRLSSSYEHFFVSKDDKESVLQLAVLMEGEVT